MTLVLDDLVLDVQILGCLPGVFPMVECVRVVTAAVQGPRGLPGTNGTNGGAYVHDQGAHGGPAALWTIVHNLGYRPGGVLVEDTSGQQWDGEVSHVDGSTLTIEFNAAFSGYAYVS